MFRGYGYSPDPDWEAIDRDSSLDAEQKEAKRQALRKQKEAVKEAERAHRIQQRAEGHVAFKEAVRDLQADKPLIGPPISDEQAVAKLTLSPVTTDWLVDGLIPFRGISTVFGYAGVGKSRLLYDLGYHVALGRPWHDFAVRQGNVLIFTDSSSEAITRTMDSIASEIGVPDWRSLDAFKIVDGLPEAIGDDVVFARQLLIRYYDAFDPVMVGIDPLSGVKRTAKDKENADLLQFQLAPSNGALVVTHRCTGRDDSQFKSLHRLPHTVVQREITVEMDRRIIHRGVVPVVLTVLPPDARRLLELIPATGPIRRNALRIAYNRDGEAFNLAEGALLGARAIERLPGYPPTLQRTVLSLPAPQETK